MAVTLRASNGHIETTNLTTATNHTINLSDAAVGDVRVVVYVGAPAGTTPAAGTFSVDVPTGWTEIGVGNNTGAVSDQYIRQFYRVVQGGDTLTSATLNVTYTGGSLNAFVDATTWEGVDSTTLDATPPTWTKTSAVPTSPSITTVTDGAVVINAFVIDVGTGTSDTNIPAGTTLLGTQLDSGTGNGVGMGVVYETIATAGASGVATWTGVSSEEHVGTTFALRPAPEGGNYDQTSFQGYNDDATPTTKAALNTNWNQIQDENFRVRFLVQEDDDVEDLDVSFQLQYNLNSGGWNDVNGASSVVRSFLSSNIVEDGNTSQVLGAGTFVSPNGGYDETDGITAGTADFSATINEETEVEYCCQIRSADTSRGDSIQLRVINGVLDTPLTTYTNTPTVTIPEGAGMMVASAYKKVDTAGAENPAIFDFSKSLPWVTITRAIRPDTSASGAEFLPGTKFNEIQHTTGKTIVEDDTVIDGGKFADLQLDTVRDLSDVIAKVVTLKTAGTYTFSNVQVTDIINDDATGNAAINSTNGSVLPTLEPGTGNGEVNIIASVPVSVTVLNDVTGLAIGTTARVRVMLDSDKSVVLNAACNASGVAETTYGGTTPVDIVGWAREFNISAPDFVGEDFSGQITADGFSQTIRLKPI